MLKNLTIEGGLQEDHLDFLWNLTEKVRRPWVGVSTLTLSLG